MSAAPVPPHPRVPVWLRPLTRRRGEVQFGVLPGGPVVTGVSEAEADLLAQLDGALPLASTDRVAAEAGVAAARWQDLLELATGLGVLTDVRTHWVEPRRGRLSGRVVVDGAATSPPRSPRPWRRPGATVVHGRAAVDRSVAAPLRPDPTSSCSSARPSSTPAAATCGCAMESRTCRSLRPGRAPSLAPSPTAPRAPPASGASTVTAPTATMPGPG